MLVVKIKVKMQYFSTHSSRSVTPLIIILLIHHFTVVPVVQEPCKASNAQNFKVKQWHFIRKLWRLVRILSGKCITQWII